MLWQVPFTQHLREEFVSAEWLTFACRSVRRLCVSLRNMSNTHDTPDDQNELSTNELRDLKRQARTNALRLKIAQQNAALAALRSQGYSDKLEGYDDRMAHG